MHDVPTRVEVEAFVIDPTQPIHRADMPRLRQEDLFVDEPPQRDERIDAACALVTQPVRVARARIVSELATAIGPV